MTVPDRATIEVLVNVGKRIDDLLISVQELTILIAANKSAARRQRLRALWVIACVGIIMALTIANEYRVTSELTQGRQVRLATLHENCLAINDSNSVITALIASALAPVKPPIGLSEAELRSFKVTDAAARVRTQAFAALVAKRTQQRDCAAQGK